MLSPESRDYGLLERLADEFAERHRRGERPTVAEYVEKYPALADDLREILPAMAELESVQKAPAAPAPPTAEGERTLGDFRILREIGRGGMGVVYEAEQVSLGRRVALKVLTQRLLTDAKQKRRFEREARAAARLHHTNIVPVFGFGENDATPFYVMQFIHGLGLEKVIEELAGMAVAGKPTAAFAPPDPSVRDVSAASVAGALLTGTFAPAEAVADEPARTVTGAFFPADPGPPPSDGSSVSSATSSVSLPGQGSGQKLTYWQSVARVGAQVAEALDYAHKQGVIHRDIKPSNLLLDLTGTVWVADFGLAKADDQQDLTNTGDILGTLRYMPPEAFVGKADARGDIYALGLTLYEMVALRPAFDERDRHKLIGLVTAGTPPALRSVRPDVPRDLETIVQKAADRDPIRRYATAGELAADLRRFIADEPIKARRQTATEAAWRWARRHPGTAVLGAVILLLMVAVTVGSAVAATYFDRLAGEARRNAVAEAGARRAAEEQEREATRLRAESDAQRRAAEVQVARQFSEAGTRLAADGDVSGALLWNVEALKTLGSGDADPELAATVRTRVATLLREAPVPSHLWVRDAAIVGQPVIDPTGRLVAVRYADGKVVLYDLETGLARGEPLDTGGKPRLVEFTRDGSRLVTVGNPRPITPFDELEAPADTINQVRVWETGTGRLLNALPGGFGSSDQGRVLCLGDTRLALCPDPETCRLYDLATGREAQTVFHKAGWRLSVEAVSAGGSRLIVMGHKSVPQPKLDAPRFGPGDGGGASEFAAWVVDVSDPARPVVWQVADAENPYDSAGSLGFSPDGSHVCSVAGGRLRVFDAAGKVRAELPSAFPGGGWGGWQPLFSPDGRVLLAQLQEVREGRKPQLLELGTGKWTELAAVGYTIDLGPRGRAQLARAAGGRFAVFDTATGGEAARLPDVPGARMPHLSPDGQVVVVPGGGAAHVFSAATGQRVLPRLVHESPNFTAQFTPDGSRLVTATGRVVRVWPLARQESAVALDPKAAAAFITPDGTHVVTLAHGEKGDGMELRLWGADGTPRPGTARLPVVGQVPTGIFDPTGRRLLLRPHVGFLSFGSASRSDFWVLELDGMTLHAPAVAEPETAPQLGGVQWARSTARYWAPTGGAILEVSSFFLAGGRGGRGGGAPQSHNKFPARPNRTVRVLGPDTKPLTQELSFPGLVVACWAPDGTHILVARADTGRWRCALHALRAGHALELVREFPDLPQTGLTADDFNTFQFGPNAMPSFHFSANGGRVVVCSTTGGKCEARVWDTVTGREIEGGAPLALGDTDVSFGLRRAAMGNRLSADGRTLFARCSLDHNVGLRVIDPGTGRDRYPMLVPPSGQLLGFAVSPDETRLLTCDGAGAHLWSARDGRLLAALGHAEGVQTAEFSADGRRVVARATGSVNNSFGGGLEGNEGVRVWDAATGQPLYQEPEQQSSSPNAFDPFGDGAGGSRTDRNGTRVVRIAAAGGARLDDIGPDSRSADELRPLVEALAARRVSGGTGLVVRAPSELAADWALAAGARKQWGAELTGASWSRDRLVFRGGSYGAHVLVTLGERWHLDRLIPEATGAERQQFLGRRARLAASWGEWEQVLRDVAVPGDVYGWQLRIDARAELGQWAEAGDEVRGYLKWSSTAEPAPNELRAVREVGATFLDRSRMLLALKAGDRAEFDRALADAEKRISGKQGGDFAPQFGAGLWPVLLTSGEATRRAAALFQSNRMMRFGANDSFPVGAAVAHRAGRSEDAVKLLEPSFAANGCSTAECLFLALAAKASGKDDLAERALARAEAQIAGREKEPDNRNSWDGSGGALPYQSGWQRKVANELLLREARELIRGKKP